MSTIRECDEVLQLDTASVFTQRLASGIKFIVRYYLVCAYVPNKTCAM